MIMTHSNASSLKHSEQQHFQNRRAEIPRVPSDGMPYPDVKGEAYDHEKFGEDPDADGNQMGPAGY